MAPPSSSSKRRLVVIDGANAIYRAFFGLPSLRAPDGAPTNAAYGFVNMLTKIVREEAPDFLVVAFDPRGGSFRNRIFEAYKAGRDAQPEDLSAQIPVVKDLIDAHAIPLIEIPDFEADDVIATLVEQAAGEDIEVVIVSTDKDLMQLVSDHVTLLDGMKGRRYDPAEVEARFGVPPHQILDLRSLVGDSSDNIPGVKGIGEKGAAQLIREWDTLENLLEHQGEVKAKRARTALEEYSDDAVLSKELSALRSDVDLGIELDALAVQPPDLDRLRELYKRLGFTRLVEGLDAGSGGTEAGADRAPSDGGHIAVEVIADVAALERAVDELLDRDDLVLHLVTDAGSAVSAVAVGLAIARDGERAFYVPIVSDGARPGELPGIAVAASAEAGGISPEDFVSALQPLFDVAAKQRRWIAENVKQTQSVLDEMGLLAGCASFDVQLAAFLLEPSGTHDVTPLAARHLGRELETWEELVGRGAKAISASEVPTERMAQWAAGQVCAIHTLVSPLQAALERDGLAPLFEEVEMPLTAVLSRMERSGVRIDEARLEALSVQYESDVARLELEIFELAGEEFLVGSPKQLQVILFEKLNLPPLKKTKTGFSTAESVLEQLSHEHELPGKVLAWRRLSKLQSTYIEALPKLVDPRTGRIHPHFNQMGAATGRMSASDPNVQNIPIRTEEGIRIREAFVPAEGNRLLSADYSQVELRVLAHYSGDDSLVDAFSKGEDIHRRTAAEVAGISTDDVTADQRARAKAVNFGIIYGSSAFGLANQLGIAAAEAQETIDAYFSQYKGVKRFLEETIAEAKERGYVTTLLGRRRYLPDLGSRNRSLRQAAERMAVNTVIQGTAADLIKRAMVAVDAALIEQKLGARMILQVHDELVFEVPKTELDAVDALARRCMEQVLELRVPLVVDVGIGQNWREAH